MINRISNVLLMLLCFTFQLKADSICTLENDVTSELTDIFEDLEYNAETPSTFIFFSSDFKAKQTRKKYSASAYLTDETLKAANEQLKILNDKDKRTIIYYKFVWCSEKEPAKGCIGSNKIKSITDIANGVAKAQQKSINSKNTNVFVCVISFIQMKNDITWSKEWYSDLMFPGLKMTEATLINIRKKISL